jgi:predicted nucleic acid-binding Zn finger protein
MIVITTTAYSGSQNNEYVCLDKYCSCPSYFNQVKLVQGKVEVLCKHLLAIRVALMLKRFESEYVSDELFVELLCVDTATGDASSTSKPYRNWRRQQQ